MIYRVDLLLPSGRRWRPLVAADSELEATAKARSLCLTINGKEGTLVGITPEPWERPNRPRLTEAEVRAIRVAPGPSRVVAGRYGVSAGHVRSIRRGGAWFDVPA